MVAPINYGIQIPDPTQAFTSAFNVGAGIREAEAKQQQAQRQLQMDQQIAAARQKVMSPNATGQDYLDLAMMLPENLSKPVREAYALRTEEQNQKSLREGGQVFSALVAGQPEIALSMIDSKIEAARNSGNQDAVNFLTMNRKLVESSPESARVFFGAQLSQLPGGDKLIDNINNLQKGAREEKLFGPQFQEAKAKADAAVSNAVQQGVLADFAMPMAMAALGRANADAIKAASDASFADALNQAGLNEKNWNVRNVQSQISNRSAQLGLDAQKTSAEVANIFSQIAARATEIPAASQKLVNDAAVSASAAKQQATQFNSLATELEKLGGGYGVFSTANDFLTKTTGRKDYATQLRQDYTRLRNSAVIDSLPKGAASDRDIAIVLEGFPPPTADAKRLAGFMRGMAKLQDITAAVEGAKVDWLAGNRGNLTRANSAFVAGDYRVNPGETWVDFSSRVVGDVSKRYVPTADQRIEQIPTGAAPIPAQAAPGPSIRSQADAIIGVR